MVTIRSDLIPRSASNRPGTRQNPTKIVVHETANTANGANAAMHSRYIRGQDARTRSVSWHFTVDDTEILQHLPINERGWHAGSGNVNSVGIELCVNADGNWQRTKANAGALIAHLRTLGITNITTHQQETGKNCPARLLREGFQTFVRGIGSSTSNSGNSWYGRSGADVRELQELLLKAGESLPGGADGQFGDETLRAVQSFQRKHGISSPGSSFYGVPGPETMNRLKRIGGRFVDLQKTLFESNNRAIRDLVRRHGVSDMEKRLEEGTLPYEDLIGTLFKAMQQEPPTTVSSAHQAAWKKAENKQVLNGERPKHFVTREQLASVLDRTGNLD
ncbi:N-acetylmuramoyl-L-alanine amidase CwlH precursor [Geomicrobium sp. JCM 19037]|uniref:peptidoglycan recognition protein family protein n=1 Tax=unclassified Geomicrobium TaxID=2628951 RepID=UPI00045F3090|nr:N-acetylmuramoyl-L-alanine amidase [Geomicrobium sp. JCM 19037]GAK06240.1 N-acetylmuramoyl-L-alanine amidase CwlH precursor [Geomicrobium sp. JCM 19037]